MKRLLAMTGAGDDELRSSLEVIGAFDERATTDATLDDLVALAAELIGARVVLRDDLTDRTVIYGEAGEPRVRATEVRRVTRAAAAGGLTGPRATRLSLEDGDAAMPESMLAVSVEHADRRLGLAWAVRPGRPWRVPDELALERLAKEAAIRLLQDHERSLPLQPDRVRALKRLLTTPLGGAEAALVARQAGLDPRHHYRVTVLQGRPVGAAGAEVILARALRAYSVAGVPARGCLLGEMPVVVVDASASAVDALRAGQNSSTAWWMDAGVSHPMTIVALAEGVLEARQSLALARDGGRGRVGVSDELGALRLLAAIPATMLEDHPDVQAICRLAAERDADINLAVLDVYCEVGSLRKTAAHLHLHHSSVDYRLKRIEQVMGFALTTQAGRLRALISLQLARLLREGAAG